MLRHFLVSAGLLCSVEAWVPPLRFATYRAAPAGGRGSVSLAAESSALSRRLLLGGAVGAFATLPATSVRAAGRPVFSPDPALARDLTVVITGANTGLGLETAKRLAESGARVIVTARTDGKVRAAVEEVARAAVARGDGGEGGARVVGATLDLGDLKSVAGFPERLSAALGGKEAPAINVLVNNAGVMAIPERRTTRDGFERQLGVNHLGHYALVAALLPSLKRGGAAAGGRGFRVVTVSSEASKLTSANSVRGAIDAGLDPPAYSAWGNYGISKAANVLFTKELQRRLDAGGVRASAVALHPGVVATELSRYIVMGADGGDATAAEGLAKMSPLQQGLARAVAGALLTPEEGANTQVFLASGSDSGGDLAAHGGLYYDAMKESTPFNGAEDAALARSLWDLSAKLTGATIAL